MSNPVARIRAKAGVKGRSKPKTIVVKIVEGESTTPRPPIIRIIESKPTTSPRVIIRIIERKVTIRLPRYVKVRP